MKLKFFMISMVVLFISQTCFGLTGREIMEKNDALKEPVSAKSVVCMTINKGKRIMKKEFGLTMKKFKNGEDKALIAFYKPTKIKLLTHAHKNRDDDQWLRLSSGKLKRIASSDKGKAFVNSHFYYEDMSSRDIDDYEYTLVSSENILGADCFKIDAFKKKGRKVYDKLSLFVRKTDFFILKIDFYKKGRLHKYLENYDIKAVKGILTPFKIVMYTADGKASTHLNIKSINYNIQIKKSKFNKEALR